MVSKAENNLSLLHTFNKPFQPNIIRQSEHWNPTLCFWESGVHYPRVSLGFHPLTKKPEDSGYRMRLMQTLSIIVKYFDYEMDCASMKQNTCLLKTVLEKGLTTDNQKDL